jgi:hypothetical protein
MVKDTRIEYIGDAVDLLIAPAKGTIKITNGSLGTVTEFIDGDAIYVAFDAGCEGWINRHNLKILGEQK